MRVNLTDDQVLQMLWRAIDKAGSQRAWARANGISAPYLTDILHRRRGLSDAICAKLGVTRTVVYAVTYKRIQGGK